MMKPMTKAELEKRNDLLPEDKEIIERCVFDYGGHNEDPPDIPAKQAIRGYLVSELDENVIDDDLREELSFDAACFADGWEAAMEYQKTASV